jgi:Zn-dependent protease with chaperone function
MILARRFAPLVLVSLLTACQTTKLPPQTVGAHPIASTDEAGLWMVMDKQEAKLRESPVIERSPELNAYVRSVLCRLAADYCGDLRLYIVKQPYFNANVAPNGAVQVWTGLLLRADNEAQLAFVLGHELGHYVNRDSLRQVRSAEDMTGGALIFAAATAGVGGGLVSGLVAMTSIYDYSRDLERGADQAGFETMRRAGYAPDQCAEIWRRLAEEVAHSDIDAVRKEEAHGSIFKTHPLTSERIATLARLSDTVPKGGDLGEDRYRAAIAPFIAEWTRDDVHRGDYGESLFLLDHLIAEQRQLGTLYFERGEAFRLRRKPGDAELAQDADQMATQYPDAPPQTWRQLGELHERLGHHDAARAAFLTYLQKQPDADDRAMIEANLARP